VFPLVVALIGCASHHTAPTPGYLKPGGPVLGTVNGQPVTRAVIDAELAQLPEEFRLQLEASGQREEMEQQILLKEALYQEAIAENVLRDDALQVSIAISARDAMIEALLFQIADERASDASLEAWYDANSERFAVRQASAAHILVENEDDALAIREELSEGARFEDLAREQSIDPAAALNGGELGWFNEQQMVPEFAAAVFAAEAESVVGPVESQFGWHVIFVNAFRDAVPLEEVRDDIIGIVQEEVVGEYIEALRLRAVGGATPPPDESLSPEP
jgi:peptidyl-prolyl cis-trans isomerase C